MAPRQVSNNLKAHIPVMHQEGFPVKTICCLLGVKKSLVYSILQLFETYRHTTNPFKYSCHIARPRSLSLADFLFLAEIVEHCGLLYLDELQNELRVKRGIDTSLSTLTRALQQLNVSCKIVSAYACEQNDEVRALYMNRIAEEVPDANMLMFIDEAAKDERTLSRKYGRSYKGVRCVARRKFVRGLRYSIVPVITLDGIIAYDIVEGPVDNEQFVTFLKEQVVYCNHFQFI
jgi:transposase